MGTTVWLDSLDISYIQQDWGQPQRNKSVNGRTISIGGRQFDRGVGTQAKSVLYIDLGRGSQRFFGFVGIDDEMKDEPASVVCDVVGDKKLLWSSGPIAGGEPAKQFDVDLTGVERLLLRVFDTTGKELLVNHVDWAQAGFTVVGQEPRPMRRPAAEPYVLTPKPSDKPRINGAKLFGARLGSPILYRIAATGKRPMTFGVKRGLPDGLKLDPQTGQFTGCLEREGRYEMIVTAANDLATVEREFTVVVGDNISLTPPMGWNSWNCWGIEVDEDKLRQSARAIRDSGLLDHGWNYINIDDTWQGKRNAQTGAMEPNSKFSDMKKLCDDIHEMGLKIGIYSTPFVGTYAGHIGGTADRPDGTSDGMLDEEQVGRDGEIFGPNRAGDGLGSGADHYRYGKHSFHDADVKQWAKWGVDFLKYDWHPIDVEHCRDMSLALRNCGRDIVYSLSNSAPFEHADRWAELSNCWRTGDDIRISWASVSTIGFAQDKWRDYAGNGHWNDPDMLVIGYLGWGDVQPTRLTADEQYAHVSLWCLLAAPLILGCDLSQLDEFTMNLLTNDEVLEVNQDPLGRQGCCVAQGPFHRIVAKEMEDGSQAVGLFSLDDFDPQTITCDFTDLGIPARAAVRDLWRQKDLGVFEKSFATEVPSHGVVMVSITPIN